jgi:protein tyrosine phosphatase (PTP) superfamily phosphohydrolase (DUF442 family)
MASRGPGRRLYDLERRWRAHYNVAPDTPEMARRARIYMRWFDHEILRHLWTNQHEVAPGVLRSNHPTEARLERLARDGLRAVLTLRGTSPSAHNLLEQAKCKALGLPLHAVALGTRRAPPREALIELIDIFRRIERPFLLHCKSGADRAGLASAIYLMVIEGRSLEEARRMLSLRYFHVRNSHAGELDRVLDGYARDGGGLSFEDWVCERYDRDSLPPR